MKSLWLIAVCLASLVLFTQCSPKTGTKLEGTETNEDKETKEPTEITMTEAEKKALKEELKEELRKEMEAEAAKKEAEELARKEKEAAEMKDKDPVKPPKPAMSPESAAALLQGAWNWKQTVYDLRGNGRQVDSPQAKGFSKKAIFKPGNKVEMHINNFNAVTYDYRITTSVTGNELFIDFSNPDPQGDTQLMEDGPLILEQNYFEIRGGYNDRGGTISYNRF